LRNIFYLTHDSKRGTTSEYRNSMNNCIHYLY
jgi:hypothetical protein